MSPGCSITSGLLLRYDALMPREVPERYAFGDFTVDVADRRLVRDATVVAVPPKAFDLLVVLLRRPGALVTKQELLNAVWPATFVEEGILTVYVAQLRKQLGDTFRPASYVETVSGFGYRFIAPVSAPSSAAGLATSPSVRRAETDDLLEQGSRLVLAGSPAALLQAVDAFRAAIGCDSTCAAAYAGLALARCAQAQVHAEHAAPAYDDAKRAALRALALDDRCAEAQLALGTVLLVSEWDWVGAERSLRRALELDGEYTEALLRYGNLLDALGRMDEGLAMKLQAHEYEPASPVVLLQVAIWYFNQRRFDDTIVWARRALERDPGHPLARNHLALSYWAKGEKQLFVAEMLALMAALGFKDAAPSGSLSDAERVEQFLLKTSMPSDRGGAPPIRLAILNAQLGRTEAAFRHLDEAMAERDPAVVYLRVSPLWDPLRDDPRFAACLDRLSLPPANHVTV